MSVQVIIYNSVAEENRVDKTAYLTQIASMNCNLLDTTSIIAPVLTVELSHFPTCNYAYIPTFNRFYFVRGITSVRTGLWEVILSVDALMTYKDGILSTTAFVDRNEYESSPYVVDGKRTIELGQTVDEINIENEIFEPVDRTEPLTGSYVLNGYCLFYGGEKT